MHKNIREYLHLSRLPVSNHWKSAFSKVAHYNSLTIFEQNAVVSWIVSYLKYAFTPRNRFLPASEAPNETFSHYQMPNALRISVAGDWGTGTDESEFVAQQMMIWEEGGRAEFTIHLGDVYYVGDERETRQNCLGGKGLVGSKTSGVMWPLGSKGSFALNGNHEMYAGGEAYFRTFLPTLGIVNGAAQGAGQGPSFFCIENDYWRIIGIDTGYNSVGLPILSLWFEGNCKLESALIDWLRNVVKPKANPKATILMSHHQYFSAFEGKYPLPAQQLAEFFDEPVLWLWGHEHRLAGYELYGLDRLKAYGRCIGHGGMPVEAIQPDPKTGLAGQLAFYDARINPLYPGDKLGLNGFAQLRLQNEDLTIQYNSLSPVEGPKPTGYKSAPDLLLTESFRCHGAQIAQTHFQRHCTDANFVTFHPQTGPATTTNKPPGPTP